VGNVFSSYPSILASCFKIVLPKLELHLPSLASGQIFLLANDLQIPTLTRKLRFFNIYLFTIYKVNPNSILFDIIKFYSTESIFKIIWIVCIELWEVYINFIWSQFGLERHLLAFSINKRNQYGGRETLHR
jgi:hypothetical protein